MPGLIRRTLMIGGAAAAAGGLALWRWRAPGAKDIAYGNDPRQVMDLTLPRGTSPAPILVMVHGGAFRVGDKSDLAIWPEILDAGIAVVRVNYRLSGTAKWPAQGEDVLAAIVHLQREGAELGLDPSRIVLLGQSAGAFLAVGTALSLVEVGLRPRGVVSLFGPMDFSTMDQDMKTLGRTPQMGWTDPADSAESQLLGYAVGDRRAEARAMGPIGRLSQLKEPLPPILIRHGDADPLIADLQAKRLREAWLAADPTARVDYKLVPGAGHGGEAFETDPVRTEVLAFVRAAVA
ncbi:alpha/beta hydrolase [Rhodobacter calidifons]|uniref:Alpha/beta hydrolase n=1 Tax=Rhodobacter calidifons TaxID=2715277 RepID=A0ABX0G8V9_9RHOB|nr:alpha/beta hydrolase [Rhodobacter calidifons]NHB77679.1 alpha/beta hydrolase [Rhodobacter calidifons]